jgi:DNA polymerase-3 subunit delta
LKYQNVSAFEKHLEQAAKIQLARVFLVVSPCSHERKRIVGRIVSVIGAKEGEISFHSQDAAEDAIDGWIDGLNTATLLMGKQVLYLDGVDKLKKNGMTRLCAYVASPSPFAWLLVGAGSSRGLTELYAKGKKEVVACDLSEEKPWDRKERLKRSLVAQAAKAGRRISADALEHLLENVGLNLAALENEVDKVITYAGERRELVLQDVLTLCATQKSLVLWQLADAIVWREGYPKIEEGVDLGLLLPLISCLRTQLQQGLMVALLLERGVPHGEIAQGIPGFKAASLDKILPVARERQSPFFKRALGMLFDIELLAKNSAFDPALILDMLMTKLDVLKRYTSGR